MALGRHAFHDVRILHHLAAHHEECGMDVPFLQTIQQPGRTAGRRPVVEGQGHIFDILHLRRAVGGRGVMCLRQLRPGAGRDQQQRRQQ